MNINMVGAFIRNAPFGTEIAFAKGLRRLGHTVNEIDTSYPDQRFDRNADATVIFKWMEGEYWGDLEECKGPKIVYQPDDARFPHIRQMIADMRHYCNGFLSFDGYSADLAQKMGYRHAEVMLLTADDELYFPAHLVEKDIDVSFVGSLTRGSNHASRVRMCEVVQRLADERGWITWFGETYFTRPPTPVEIYRRSKVVINHATDVGQQFGFGFGLQCRHFEAGMTETVVLSNKVDGSSLDFPYFDSEEMLGDQLGKILKDDNYKSLGRQYRKSIMSDHLPQHRARQLVDFIGRF